MRLISDTVDLKPLKRCSLAGAGDSRRVVNGLHLRNPRTAGHWSPRQEKSYENLSETCPVDRGPGYRRERFDGCPADQLGCLAGSILQSETGPQLSHDGSPRAGRSRHYCVSRGGRTGSGRPGESVAGAVLQSQAWPQFAHGGEAVKSRGGKYGVPRRGEARGATCKQLVRAVVQRKIRPQLAEGTLIARLVVVQQILIAVHSEPAG